MKRVLTWAAVPLIAIFLGGCTDGVEKPPMTVATSSASEMTPASPTSTPEVGDFWSVLRRIEAPVTLDSGGVTVTVEDFGVMSYSQFYDRQDASAKRILDSARNAAGAKAVGFAQISVANTTSEKASIHPAQGTVVAGAEQVYTELVLSDDVGGDIFPGVTKSGAVMFFLHRTEAEEISSVLYAINGPFGEVSGRRLGPDYEFTLAIP